MTTAHSSDPVSFGTRHDGRPLILLGAGRLARTCIEICEQMQLPIRGCLDEVRPETREVLGYPMLGHTTLLNDDGFVASHRYILAIGDITARRRLWQLLRHRSAAMATIIHPSSVVSPRADIGAGVVVGACAYVSPGARLGDAVYVEDHVSIGVDVTIGENCVIAPGATLTASALVGANSFIGAASTVLPEVEVGPDNVIGASTCVRRDTPANAVCFGVPAKTLYIRKRG
jgi:sugar O-acyltransferase (sialic acid O-acetyltransferase NeuD family)